MKESDILHEVNGVWVSREKVGYVVWKPSASGTHCVIDSAYALDADGLSIAKARCSYLGNRVVA